MTGNRWYENWQRRIEPYCPFLVQNNTRVVNKDRRGHKIPLREHVLRAGTLQGAFLFKF